MLNASYTQFKYTNLDLGNNVSIDNPNISQIIANAGYIYPLTSSLTWGNVARYHGQKELANSSGTIDPVLLLDTTLRYHFKKDFIASLNVKNLLNTIYYYPASGTNVVPMQREGRVIYADIQYDF